MGENRATMLRARLRNLNARLWPRHLMFGPEWLVLGVNNHCNLRCKMCDVGLARTDTTFARNLVGTRPLDMPLDLLEHVIDEGARHYPGVRIGFAFTEPLMYPHLLAGVTRARQRGLGSAVTTNGLLLPRLADDLAEAGLDNLQVSLDGPEEVHDQIRGRRGSFARAYAGLERLAGRSRRPALAVFCVITPWNAGRLADFVAAFEALPLSTLGFLHTNFTTAAMAQAHNAIWGHAYPATLSNVDPLDPADVDLGLLDEQVRAVRARSTPFPVSFSPPLDGLAALTRFYRRPHELIGRSCSDAARSLMIKSDGSAIPSHGRCYEVPVGNLRRASLPGLWNGAPLADFRAALAGAGGLLPACARCCSAF